MSLLKPIAITKDTLKIAAATHSSLLNEEGELQCPLLMDLIAAKNDPHPIIAKILGIEYPDDPKARKDFEAYCDSLIEGLDAASEFLSQNGYVTEGIYIQFQTGWRKATQAELEYFSKVNQLLPSCDFPSFSVS